jgi:hypothetical protein
MRSTPPLLCELHAHTTWSDGSLSVRELVDLYGGAGFNVLAVTDHVVRPGESQAGAVRAPTYDQYLDDLQAEGERALATYGLLLVPGLELTYDDPDPRLGAHVLTLGVRRFIGLERGLEAAIAEAADAGAALSGRIPTRWRRLKPRTGRRRASPRSPSGRRRPSTASSSATATTSSIGLRERSSRRSRTATSITPSISRPGRRSFRRSGRRMRFSRISARAIRSR